MSPSVARVGADDHLRRLAGRREARGARRLPSLGFRFLEPQPQPPIALRCGAVLLRRQLSASSVGSSTLIDRRSA